MQEKILYVVKFIAFIFLIPCVIAVSVSFANQMRAIQPLYRQAFFWGMHTYLLLHLFVYAPVSLFEFGRKVIVDIFKFSPIVAEVLKFILPLYAAILLIVFYVGARFLLFSASVLSIILFLVGLSLTMHVVLTGRELHEGDGTALKPHYFLVIGLTYMVNLIFLGLWLGLAMPEFSLREFFKTFWNISGGVYIHCFEQLFVAR